MKTGGQVFPNALGREGMTLRDYFAGQALIPLVPYAIKGGHLMWDDAVETSYQVADKMIEQREKEINP